MCLQELILGQINKPSVKGYCSLHSTGRGGAGLFIRADIHFAEIQLRTTLQAVAATVYIGKQYTVCSVYLPPTPSISYEELAELLQQLPRPALLLGDFNARDPLWGDCLSSPRAPQIKKIMDDLDMGLLNSGEPTHYHEQTDTFTCIDLSLLSTDSLADFCWKVINPSEEQYDSDHFPILITRNTQNTPTPGPNRWNLRRANWEKFYAKSAIQDTMDGLSVEEHNEAITSCILRAAEVSIPLVRHSSTAPTAPFWNGDCEAAKRTKRRLLHRWQRTRLLCDRIEYKHARAIERKTINEARRTSWKQFVSSINSSTPPAKVWSRLKKIAGKHKSHTLPIVRDDNGQIQTDPKVVAEIIGEKLSSYSSGQTYTDYFQRLRLRLEQKAHSFGEQDTDYNVEFSFAELKEALGKCGNTSPGPDTIQYDMIKHLHPTALTQILNLFNKIWEEGIIPDIWRLAIVIPIKKEGKDGLNPSHYRPISLTCNLCKLLERMVCARLQWYLDQKDIIDQKQFGFRKHHCTADPLLILEHDISQAFAARRSILAVSFDLEKAYDTTWRWGILEALYEMGLRGRLPNFVAEFLKHRKFKTRIGSYLSQEKPLIQGVPQGAVSSCALFKVAINGIARVIPDDIKYSLYVDDLLIYYEGGHLPTMIRKLQLAINNISQWAENHGYTFSRNKTQSILFSRRGKRCNPSLKIYNQEIPATNSLKFLGIVFDSRLTWSNHVKKLKDQCHSPLSLLKHVSHLSGGADKKTLTTLYKALVQSKLLYACEIFSSNEKIIGALNKIQNQGLRIISGAFRSSPIASLQVDCSVPPLDLQICQRSGRHYLRLKPEIHSPTRQLVADAFLSASPWSFRRNVQSLLGETCEEDICISPTDEYKIPPWLLTPANVCESVSKTPLRTIPLAIAASFREHSASHEPAVFIYTDGSKNHHGVGSAVVIPSLGLSDSRSLPNAASIYTAEAIAIILGMELIDKLPQERYIVCSDSQSVLTALMQHQSEHPIICKIKLWINFLEASDKKIIFCWSPAHIGIRGNEAADTVAKAATTDPIIQMALPYTDYIPQLKAAAIQQWQSRWDQEVNNKLHEIRPSIKKWESSFHKKRKFETSITRLRIGHCNFSHVHLMERTPQPRCCGVPLSVKHTLISCYRTQQIRQIMYPEIQHLTPSERLKRLLAEDQHFNIERLMLYIQRVGLYNKI